MYVIKFVFVCLCRFMYLSLLWRKRYATINVWRPLQWVLLSINTVSWDISSAKLWIKLLFPWIYEAINVWGKYVILSFCLYSTYLHRDLNCILSLTPTYKHLFGIDSIFAECWPACIQARFPMFLLDRFKHQDIDATR